MPIIKLNDGAELYVENLDDATVQSAIKKYQKQSTATDSPIGNIARGIQSGLISIPQGIATLGSTGVDLFFDTDVTRDINEFFEAIKPQVTGTAGETAQLITQFGLPGLGTVGALSKLSKTKQLLGAAAVDAAVATDDVDTISDMFLDTVPDEERLSMLRGQEAAIARLADRLGVFAETAAVFYATPKVLTAGVSLAKGGADLVAPYVGALVKATKAPEKQVIAAAQKADRNLFDYMRQGFTYGGTFQQTAKNNKLIADAMQAKTWYVGSLEQSIAESHKGIIKTFEEASRVGGKLTNEDGLIISKALNEYRAPMLSVERDFPDLAGGAKIKKMEEIRRNALKTIKNYEGKGNKIDYESIGITDPNNYISNVMQKNRSLYTLQERELIDLSDPQKNVTSLLIPEEFRNAMIQNQKFYGTTAYKAIVDPGFVPNPEYKKEAVEELYEKIFKKDPNGMALAEDAFEKLRRYPSDSTFETPEFNIEGLKFGSLKGKELKNLPAVRKALGEITPYGETNWKKALENEALAAQMTMSKLGTLAGKSKAFQQIRNLNDNAKSFGSRSFLKTFSEGNLPKQTVIDPATGKETQVVMDSIFEDGVEYVRFGKEAGALKDTYAPKVFHDALLGVEKDYIQAMPLPLRMIMKFALGLKAISQYGKTILGPTTQVRNLTSVPFMALLNGNLGPSGQFAKNFKLAYSGIFEPRKAKEIEAKLAEAADYGIAQQTDATLNEIVDVAKVATADSSFIRKLETSNLGQMFKDIKRVPERTYIGSDNAARLINWDGEQAKLFRVINNSTDNDLIHVTAVRNFSDPDVQKLIEIDPTMGSVVRIKNLKAAGEDVINKFVKAEAADNALNITPTYSRVPEVVKQLRYIPILGNFTAYPSEIIRNSFNTLSIAIRELASSNAELQKNGMRRLMGGLTVTAGIPSAAVATGLALTGANEDQIDAYKRSFAAPWEKTATLVPTGTDANGNITSFYNFSYTNPYDYIRRPFEAVSLAISNGNRNEASLLKIANDAAFSSVSEIVSPFIEPSMGFQAISEATQGQTSTGKIIFNESDNLGDKAVKGFAHVLNQVSPTVSPFNVSVDAAGIRFIPKDFATAAAGIITRQDDLMSAKGRPLDVGETMVSAFSGIKIIKPQLERSLYYKSSEANRAIRETTNEFNRLLRSSDIRTAEDYIKGYINSNEKRYNSLRDLYNAIEDARTLGLSDYEIDAQLKKARVASRDLVMRGIFRPLFPQEDLISEAVIAGKDIRGIYGEQARLEGQFLTGQFPKAPPEPTVQRVGGASEVLRQQEVNKLLTGQP